MKTLITLVAALLLGQYVLAQQPEITNTDPKTNKLKQLNKDKIKLYKTPQLTAKQLEVISARYKVSTFGSLKAGTPTGPNGYRQLRKISNNFEEKNQAQTKKISEKGVCIKEQLTLEANTRNFDIFAYDGAPDWLKPGVIISAKSFLDGTNKIVKLPRNPITLSTNITDGGSISRVVAEPHKTATIEEAINSIKSQGGIIGANFRFDYREIRSLSELGFYLNGKYSNKIFGAAAELGMEFSDQNEHHYYAVNFYQNMFHIDVEPRNDYIIFENEDQPVNDYLYLSRVVYGRKGLVIVKSQVDITKFSTQLEASINQLIHKGSMQAGFNILEQNKNFEIKALLYGGSPPAAVESLLSTIEKGKVDLKNYLESESGNSLYALPIGYEIKNLNDDRIGMRSVKTEPVETCVSAPVEDVKLKITLTDLLCLEERDNGDNPDDYGLRHWITYFSDKKGKKYISRNIKTLENMIDTESSTASVNRLIYGDARNQLHVEKGTERTGNINNSLVFKITPEEFSDKSTSFRIYSWLKEYTNGKDKVYINRKPIDVKINEIVAYLLYPETFNIPFDAAFYDHRVGEEEKRKEKVYWEAGNRGDVLWVKKARRNTLEGPIVMGEIGEKGATWIHFELVD